MHKVITPVGKFSLLYHLFIFVGYCVRQRNRRREFKQNSRRELKLRPLCCALIYRLSLLFMRGRYTNNITVIYRIIHTCFADEHLLFETWCAFPQLWNKYKSLFYILCKQIHESNVDKQRSFKLKIMYRSAIYQIIK